MNELQIFNNPKFGQVRTLEENGKVLFVASDIASALGYKVPHKAVYDHCKGVLKRNIPTNGGQQEMNVVLEGDIYRLAAKSELPGAEEFESWIFDEVLPSIRKHGAYITPDTLEQMVTSPEFGIRLLNEIKAEREKRLQAEALVEAQRPKVLFADAVEVSKSSILIGDLAKIIKQNGYDIGQKRLFEYMRQNEYLIKGGSSKNMPTQRSMDAGWFEVKESTINNPDGSVRITKTTKVTGKGQVYFVNLFLGKSVQKGA